MESALRFSSVQSLSRVRLFATPWTAARQASLSITNSRSSPKLMSIESVISSSHPLPSPSPPAFNISQHPGLFKWVRFSYQVARILEFQPQHQSPVKNGFIMEAETVNAATKFIRDSTATSRRTCREMVCLVEIAGRQRCRPREKGCGCPPSEEESSKQAVNSFIYVSSSGSLFTFSQLSGFFFHTWPILGPFPGCACMPQPG